MNKPGNVLCSVALALQGKMAQPTQNCLYETLGGLPGVETDYWEFDGGGPGTSTCGRDFWSNNVDATLELLAKELGLPEGAT